MTKYRDHLTPLVDLSPTWEPKWFVDSIWQCNALNILFGVPRARKTTLRRYLMACAFAQQKAFGRYAVGPAPNRALILLGEEILEAEGAYLHSMFASLGRDSTEFAGRIDILDAAAGVRLDTAEVEQLYELIQTGGYDFVAIDPLINFHRQNENDAACMAGVLARTKPIWKMATLVVTHHEGKPNENTANRATSYRARGSSAIPGYTASNIRLERTEGTDYHRLTVDAKYAKDPVQIDLRFRGGSFDLVTLDEEAKRLRDKGLSGTQIAKTLHRRKETVLEWIREPGEE